MLFIDIKKNVLQLKKKVVFSSRVQKINLPNRTFSESPAGTRVVVSGFGSNENNGRNSPILKKLYSTVASLEKCQKWNIKVITSSSICTEKFLINENETYGKYEATCTVSNKDSWMKC